MWKQWNWIGEKGTAHALSYLDHDCTPPIVHRDISASNVLLNSDWEPSVGDFGTARFLNLDSSNRTIVAGTIGYIAPGKSFSIFLFFSSYSPFLYFLLIQYAIGLVCNAKFISIVHFVYHCYSYNIFFLIM